MLAEWYDRNPETWEDALEIVLEVMGNVMIDRQNKYGYQNVNKMGPVGVLDRAEKDKITRLRNFYERNDLRARCIANGMPVEAVDKYFPAQDGDFNDESLLDAHLDAANFLGPIGVMVRLGWWNLPRRTSLALGDETIDNKVSGDRIKHIAMALWNDVEFIQKSETNETILSVCRKAVAEMEREIGPIR